MFTGLEQEEKIPVYLSKTQIEWLQKNIPEEKKEPVVPPPVEREPILVEIDKRIIKKVTDKAKKKGVSIDSIVENLLGKYLKIYSRTNKKLDYDTVMKKLYKSSSNYFDSVQLAKILGTSAEWVTYSMNFGLKADITQCHGKSIRNKYKIYKKDVIDFVNSRPDIFVRNLIQEYR